MSLHAVPIVDLKISRWGNSLAMRIPAEVAQRMGLGDGSRVEASLSSDGTLALRPAGWNRRAFCAELNAARELLPMGSSVIDELRQSARY